MTGLTVGSHTPVREREKGEDAGVGLCQGAAAGWPSAGEGGRGEEEERRGLAAAAVGQEEGAHFSFLFPFSFS